MYIETKADSCFAKQARKALGRVHRGVSHVTGRKIDLDLLYGDAVAALKESLQEVRSADPDCCPETDELLLMLSPKIQSVLYYQDKSLLLVRCSESLEEFIDRITELREANRDEERVKVKVLSFPERSSPS